MAKGGTRKKTVKKNYRKEISGLAYLFLAIFLFLSVYTFDPGDPSLNQSVAGGEIHNMAGYAGSYTVGFLIDMFGMGALLWPIFMLYLALSKFITRLEMTTARWFGIVGLFITFLAWVGHPWLGGAEPSHYGFSGSGYIGAAFISGYTVPYLGPAGAALLYLFMTVASLQLFIGFSWGSVFGAIGGKMSEANGARAERAERKRQEKEAAEAAKAAGNDAAKDSGKRLKKGGIPASLLKPSEDKPKRIARPKRKGPKRSNGELPAFDLLNPPKAETQSVDKARLEELAEILTDTLAEFRVEGEVYDVVTGPVVTMFEFKPAPGIKVSKIENLADDIAMALRAHSVRIEAPIPGKDSVGIEIPNESRLSISLRDVLESDAFRKSGNKLTLGIGQDIHGNTEVANLEKMPHLLVAGATGAGKSVGINCFLMSLLYKCSPEELKLLLVDPKRIELASYAKLPHLVHPVVTDMSLAKAALDWAVYEMDMRYDKMVKLGVRNIFEFNKTLEELGDGPRPEGAEDFELMPRLVIVIDEMADLMMTAAKEVEQSIVRLAQLARAAGIHMILATQRPSVDVVTGLIKANVPSRLAFYVTSKVDSRTILDGGGAEKLLGMGDMLFKPSGKPPKRMHGAYVGGKEIDAVVKHWEDLYTQDFSLDFKEWGNDGSDDGAVGGGLEGVADDPMYQQAVDFVREQNRGSISLLQRRFRIGYNRAARFIEQMEVDGIVGPQEGSKPRRVLKPE